MGRRILLVEGPADSSFYSALCRASGLPSVDVVPPTNYGARVASKTNAIHILPTLLQQLEDGSVENIGLVVDADYRAEHGLGPALTLDKVREKVEASGFQRETRVSQAGYLFCHPDGLAPVGLWIMPNNRDEGMLEDFIKEAVRDSEQAALLGRASSVVASLASPLFKSIHSSKAEVATWLAWQRMPGQPVASAVTEGLIDISSAQCVLITDWLRQVFP